ncbi:MAG: hypothetical protein SFY69_05075 [Planctomycetota bacterium]|nr:hypothetical protein [Planctomycetota bacterium]
MFAKCVVLILAVGACGCALLALRQSRLQVASELARTQLRISAADERLWSLRSQVAERTNPRNIEVLARGLGPLKPIVEPANLPVAQGAGPDATRGAGANTDAGRGPGVGPGVGPGSEAGVSPGGGGPTDTRPSESRPSEVRPANEPPASTPARPPRGVRIARRGRP